MARNRVTLDIQPSWFRDTAESSAHADLEFAHCLAIACEAQALVNLVYLQSHPDVRKLYDTKVRYISEPAQPIALLGIPTIAAAGGSDCKNLVAWRLAELWMQEMQPPPKGYGERKSSCKTYWKYPNPDKTRLKRVFHAEIRLPTMLPDGTRNHETVEDVSRYLGM